MGGMHGSERSCWWPVGLVLLEGEMWLNCLKFSVAGVFFLLLKNLLSFPSSEHSRHLRDYCGMMQRDGGRKHRLGDPGKHYLNRWRSAAD